MMQKLAAGEDPFKAFHDAADAAKAGAAATKSMLAQVS
jgi:dihydroxyacetone kinase